MSRLLRMLPILALLFLALTRFATAGEDDAKKKRLEAERAKKAFDALMAKAEEEYRTYFRKPEHVHEFWAAIKFEMDVGKFDLAALHLKLMLEIPPEKGDPELIKIADREGLSAFTRLQEVRLWSVYEPYQKEAEKNVQGLLDRVRKALEAHLSDPKRINFFIDNLNGGTPEERAFAQSELNRSKVRAVPYLVDALRAHAGKPLADRLVEYMIAMDEEMVEPLLEIFKVPFPEPGDDADKALRDKDAQEPNLRLSLMEVMKKRNDVRRAKGFTEDARIVPYLWHIAGGASAKSRLPYHPLVRQKARDLLAYFLRADPERLPRSEVKLAELADRIYQKKETFKGRELIPLWRWNSVELAPKPILLTPAQAREIFALRYAKEALDLTPSHQPAQIVLLSQQMDTLYRAELAKFLFERPAPGLDDLLARVDLDLLSATLEKALDEENIPVALGAIRALGIRGDPFAAKVAPATPTRGVVRGLDHPDRRVQWAAVQAIVRMPAAPSPLIATRVMDLLKRQLASDEQPRVLAIGVPDAKAPDLRAALKEMGFVPVLERDFKMGFRRLQESPDYDLVLLHAAVGLAELPYMVNQIRNDLDVASLPIVILAPMPKVDDLTKETEEKDRLAGIKVIENRVREELLKRIHYIDINIKDAGERVKLSDEARAAFAKEAERRIKEFNDAYAIEVASRRIARSREFEDKVRRVIVRQRHVTVLPEGLLGMGDELKKGLEAALVEAYAARMTPEERRLFKGQALGLLWSMSRGETPGYNIAPARENLLTVARAKAAPPELTQIALETLSTLPGAEVQQNLAAITLDPARDKLRIAAAVELHRHVKKYGVLLSKDQIGKVRKAHADPSEDVTLKGQLALVLGAMGPSPTLTGDRLFEFRPGPAAPPPEKKEKEKEKEKKDDPS